MNCAKEKKVEGRVFRHVDFGRETHRKVSFRLWLHRAVPIEENEIKFPIRNFKIEITERGNKVLRPHPDFWVLEVFVPCGHGGNSEFEILEPEEVEVFKYYHFSSLTGSLGVSYGALINVPIKEPSIKVRWRKSGRLYGKPEKGLSIYYQDGTIEELELLEDGIVFAIYEE